MPARNEPTGVRTENETRCASLVRLLAHGGNVLNFMTDTAKYERVVLMEEFALLYAT